MSFQGSISCDYKTLKRIFGAPQKASNDGQSYRVMWNIVFKDGTTASIYDWKSQDMALSKVQDWNVGGHNETSVYRVVDEIQRRRQKTMLRPMLGYNNISGLPLPGALTTKLTRRTSTIQSVNGHAY